MTALINTHGIWQEQSRWYGLIERVLDKKIIEHASNFERNKKRRKKLREKRKAAEKESKKKGFMNMAFGVASNLKKKMFTRQPKEEDSENYERGKKSTVFSVLNNFLFHFTNFNVSTDKSSSIVLRFCKKYQIDNERILQLITELEACVSAEKYRISERDSLALSNRKRENERNRFGRSEDTMIVGYVIKYVDDLKTLNNILLVNSTYYHIFKHLIHKQILVRILPISYNQYASSSLSKKKKRLELKEESKESDAEREEKKGIKGEDEVKEESKERVEEEENKEEEKVEFKVEFKAERESEEDEMFEEKRMKKLRDKIRVMRVSIWKNILRSVSWMICL